MEPTPKNLNKKPIFDQYEYFLNKYQERYGEKTTILMQVGGFYEIYGVDNEEMKIGNVKKIGSLLHIEVSRRNKEIRENSRKNYLMAGFPTAAISKFVDILLEHRYTVVIIDQEGTAKDKTKASEKLHRKVVEIYSPGTYLNANDNDENKYLVHIHLEGFQRTKKTRQVKVNYQPMTIGLSALDVTTGENDVYEVSNMIRDHNYALDEIYRYLQIHQPKELIIWTNNLDMTKESLVNYLELNSELEATIKYNQVPQDYYKLSYQKAFLEKLFPNRDTMLSVIEYLNLEKSPIGLLSYMSLLQFTYEHNEILVSNLRPPQLWKSYKHLLLANNTIRQLELYNNNRNRMGNVVNMLNLTSTSMGRRMFRDRLLNPILDEKEINRRYDHVELFLKNDFWVEIERKLSSILDLSRLHRRIELGLMSPNGFNILYQSYKDVRELLELVPISLLPDREFREEFDAYLNFLDETLDWDEMYKYVDIEKVQDNIFKNGYNEKLDEISQDIRLQHRYLENIIRQVSNVIVGAHSAPVVYHRYTESSGHYFNITANRFKSLNEELKKSPLEFKIKKKEFIIDSRTFRITRRDKNNTSYNITSDHIENISSDLDENIKQLKKLINGSTKTVINKETKEKETQRIPGLYLKFMVDLHEKYDRMFQNINKLIAEVDVYKACAKATLKYRLCRPQIINNNGKINSYSETTNMEDSEDEEKENNSFVRAINMRHPLVERINTNTNYVPHSLHLGECFNKELQSKFDQQEKNIEEENDSTTVPQMKGLLLYGPNAVGKTSLMKSVGVNIIMAQAGMYVACDEFYFTPYHQVLTRILGNDNIFKGLSSFAVEMSELRGILARADQYSLILGDEICHGTETTSGISIVAATIQELCRRSSHFIFATHLHQLTELPEIMELPELEIYHLHVEYDPKTHTLIYNRQLQPGAGSSLYGIEVARAMDLDSNIISTANRIRQRLQDQSSSIVPMHKSRYNANLYVDRCMIRECANKAIDTHHIKFQCTADNKGYIDTIHKNEMKNLVPLCKQCHQDVHAGLIDIKGYIETSNGLILDYQLNFEDDDSLNSKLEENNSDTMDNRKLPSLAKKKVKMISSPIKYHNNRDSNKLRLNIKLKI